MPFLYTNSNKMAQNLKNSKIRFFFLLYSSKLKWLRHSSDAMAMVFLFINGGGWQRACRHWWAPARARCVGWRGARASATAVSQLSSNRGTLSIGSFSPDAPMNELQFLPPACAPIPSTDSLEFMLVCFLHCCNCYPPPPPLHSVMNKTFHFHYVLAISWRNYENIQVFITSLRLHKLEVFNEQSISTN